MSSLGRTLPVAILGSILAAAVVSLLITCAQPDSGPTVVNQYVTGGGF